MFTCFSIFWLPLLSLNKILNYWNCYIHKSSIKRLKPTCFGFCPLFAPSNFIHSFDVELVIAVPWSLYCHVDCYHLDETFVSVCHFKWREWCWDESWEQKDLMMTKLADTPWKWWQKYEPAMKSYEGCKSSWSSY